MTTSGKSSSARAVVSQALTGSNTKDVTPRQKGPPVADGVLSVTPDTAEILEWRQQTSMFSEASSTYLDDDDDGRCSGWCHRAH